MLPTYSSYTKKIKKTLRQTVPQDKTYLEITLSFLAIAFFGWFAIRPTLSTITELIKEIEIKQDIVKQLDDKIDALVAADTTYKVAKPRLFLLDEALPTDHYVAQYTAQIETIAQQVGAEIIDIQFDPFPVSQEVDLNDTRLSRLHSRTDSSDKQSTPQWRALTFQLSSQGTYLQLKNLVTQLYQLRRLTLTDSLQFRPVVRRGESDSLNLSLSGMVLYM